MLAILSEHALYLGLLAMMHGHVKSMQMGSAWTSADIGRGLGNRGRSPLTVVLMQSRWAKYQEDVS